MAGRVGRIVGGSRIVLELFFERTDEGLRLRAPWRLLTQMMLFLTGTIFFSNLLAVLWKSLGPGTMGSSSPASFLMNALASLGAALLSVWIASRFLDRRPFKDFGFHLSGEWLLDLLFGLALGALLMTSLFLIELGSGWISVAGTLSVIKARVPFLIALIVPIISFLCVGVSEELLFRGYWLRNMAEGFNFPFVRQRGAVLLAWIGSSSYFGVGHVFNPNATVVSTVNIVLAGLMLGLGYILTGELAIPIGLHITWNFFEGNVFGFSVSGISPVGATFVATKQDGPTIWTGGNFGPEAGLMGVAAILSGCLLIMLWVRLRRGKVSIHTPVAEPPKPLLPNGSDPGRASS
ncbi:MAG: CPBP family intramembrane glutamic endopeptidase [Rubrobacteraceae bacterium]